MTVNEFCIRIGISRQKFYRFVKEPRRFTQSNLRAIEEVLQLNEDDRSLLAAFLSPLRAGSASADHSEYNDLIAALINRIPSEELAFCKYNIEYNDASGSATMQCPDTLAHILAGPCHREYKAADSESAKAASTPVRHEYAFTIYNCTPSKSVNGSMSFTASRKSLLMISRIIDVLERILTSPGRISVRHYLSESQRKLLLNEDINDRKAVQYNLKLLNCILPLLSNVTDYSIDRSGTIRQFWTEHSNVCLIEHRCSAPLQQEGAVSGRGSDISKDVCTEYYILLFSDAGECSACRLGDEEAAHIFRFLSYDTLEKPDLFSEQHTPVNPNQFYKELDQKTRNALIHPDLCFDDIPKEMWMALYKTVRESPDKVFFESVFRNLIDPYDQYAFLSFDEIVAAAINTLDQRFLTNNRLGKIVICHPEGLQNLVRNGIIQDLVSNAYDHTRTDHGNTTLRFPAPLVKSLLELIRSNISNRITASGSDPDKGNTVNYYILHPHFPYPEDSLIFYKDYGFSAFYNKGRNRHKIVTVFQNAAIGTLLYDYIVNTMLRNRGRDLDSGVMSDEHALSLLDTLILEVEESMK